MLLTNTYFNLIFQEHKSDSLAVLYSPKHILKEIDNLTYEGSSQVACSPSSPPPSPSKRRFLQFFKVFNSKEIKQVFSVGHSVLVPTFARRLSDGLLQVVQEMQQKRLFLCQLFLNVLDHRFIISQHQEFVNNDNRDFIE